MKEFIKYSRYGDVKCLWYIHYHICIGGLERGNAEFDNK